MINVKTDAVSEVLIPGLRLEEELARIPGAHMYKRDCDVWGTKSHHRVDWG
jgi:hypothetical protein